MANVDAAVLLDFISSLAVLGLLVVSFSALAPALRNGWYAPPLLGVFFGLVVGLQMSMPLSPTNGVIIDMRNVPIVLAGAFLGLRGLLVCLGIAVGIRIGIGGIGMTAGILGMLIAGAVGYSWARLFDRIQARDSNKLVILGLAVNLHMLSAFAVPQDIMVWYFTEAAPTVFILNSICVPALGWMLLREQNHVLRQVALSESAPVDPVTRLLTLDAFTREVSHFNAADDDHHVAGIVALTLKNTNWLTSTWGDDAAQQALGALRIRLTGLFGDQRPMGIDPRQRILVPITARQMQDLRPLRHALRRLASDTPVSLEGGVDVPLSILIESFSVQHPNRPDKTLKDIRRSVSARRQPASGTDRSTHPPQHRHDPTIPDGMCVTTFHRLFDETDVKIRRVRQRG